MIALRPVSLTNYCNQSIFPRAPVSRQPTRHVWGPAANIPPGPYRSQSGSAWLGSAPLRYARLGSGQRSRPLPPTHPDFNFISVSSVWLLNRFKLGIKCAFNATQFTKSFHCWVKKTYVGSTASSRLNLRFAMFWRWVCFLRGVHHLPKCCTKIVSDWNDCKWF